VEDDEQQLERLSKSLQLGRPPPLAESHILKDSNAYDQKPH